MFVVPNKSWSVKPGDTFDRYTVSGVPFYMTFSTPKKHQFVVCQCKCGEYRMVSVCGLRGGHSRSCGCRKAEVTAERSTKHGGAKRGKSERLYNIWAVMRQRCQDPGCETFKKYGARGVTVCEQWQDYTAFRRWALSSGYSDELTIDRIDTNGNYEPANCRWATQLVQQNNRRSNRLVTAFQETKTMAKWCRDGRCKADYGTVIARVTAGWPAELAITSPTGSRLTRLNREPMEWPK